MIRRDKVTKNELEQLLDLRKEIRELDEKIERMKEQRVGRVVDRVQSSMEDFPYTRITQTIEGVDGKDKKRRRELTENEMLLLRRRKQAVEEERRVTKYINGIKDSRIRRIAGMRYEEGLSWESIANKMGYDRTYPEKLLAKYMKENEAKRA